MLPITSYKDLIISTVRDNPCTIVTSPTGSGKSTQLPQFLSSYDSIAITQPRRISAISLAKRVSEEMNTPLGEYVGYTVRFDDHTGKQTKIRYITDGCLLREALGSLLLSDYKVVIVDEAHERSLQSDILLGLLKYILTKRSDLKVTVISATLNTDKLFWIIQEICMML